MATVIRSQSILDTIIDIGLYHWTHKMGEDQTQLRHVITSLDEQVKKLPMQIDTFRHQLREAKGKANYDLLKRSVVMLENKVEDLATIRAAFDKYGVLPRKSASHHLYYE